MKFSKFAPLILALFIVTSILASCEAFTFPETTTDRKDPNEGRNVICWLIPENFTSVCKEILQIYENASIKFDENGEIGHCAEFNYLNPRHPEFGNTVWARKCPTEPPFYVSDAHIWYSVFTFKPVEGGLNRTHIIGGLRSLGYVPPEDE